MEQVAARDRDIIKASHTPSCGEVAPADAIPATLERAAQGYAEIVKPFLWDTAKRCAARVELGLTQLEKTLKTARQNAEAGQDGAAEQLTYLETHIHALRAYVDEFQTFVAPHDRWSPISIADANNLETLLAQAIPSEATDLGIAAFYTDVRPYIHTTLHDACNATLRDAASGDEKLYRLIPPTLKEVLDKAHRLPGGSRWHQMFGEGISQQVAREEHPHDHLLLQLVSDPMMRGEWGKRGPVVQFWIGPDDLQKQNWANVAVTMEGD